MAISTFNQDGVAEIGYNLLPKTTKKNKMKQWFLDIEHQTWQNSDRWEREETNKVSSLIAPASWLERASRKQHREGKPR